MIDFLQAYCRSMWLIWTCMLLPILSMNLYFWYNYLHHCIASASL